jgi:hypothetical protein
VVKLNWTWVVSGARDGDIREPMVRYVIQKCHDKLNIQAANTQ